MSDDTLSTLAIAAGAAGVGWWLYQRHEHHTAEQRASAQRIAWIGPSPDGCESVIRYDDSELPSPAISA